MKKAVALVGALMLVCVGGCASESQDEQIRTTISLLDQTRTKVGNIREEVESAIKKVDPQKGLDLAEAEKACEVLKNFCKNELQYSAIKLQALRAAGFTDENRQALLDKYKGEIKPKVVALNEETLNLNKAVTQLDTLQDPRYEPAIKSFKAKLAEAQAEFETLARIK